MRVPGINSIAVTASANIPATVEMEAAAGVVPDLSGITFTSVPFVGEPVMDIEQSNVRGGQGTKVQLTFRIPFYEDYKDHVFFITTQSDEKYLIGTSDSIPLVSYKDAAAAPDTTNNVTVTVNLESFCACIRIGENEPVIDADWREITEAEVDTIINSLN